MCPQVYVKYKWLLSRKNVYIRQVLVIVLIVIGLAVKVRQPTTKTK
jgi:hypothetical protein